ncbi:hypothetical protein P8452_46142 [Trifolium repens]|nr:hypothetical protein P8452_46142 [Trifolium repens]
MKSGKYSLGYTTVLRSLRSSKEGNFKTKSDESEQDEAAIATTPDMVVAVLAIPQAISNADIYFLGAIKLELLLPLITKNTKSQEMW